MSEDPSKTSENKPARDEQGRLLPGNTANPNGRPVFSLVTILKEELQKVPEGQRHSAAYLLIQRMLKSAIQEGNDQQIKNILQYVEGMPKQPVQHDYGKETLAALLGAGSDGTSDTTEDPQGS